MYQDKLKKALGVLLDADLSELPSEVGEAIAIVEHFANTAFHLRLGTAGGESINLSNVSETKVYISKDGQPGEWRISAEEGYFAEVSPDVYRICNLMLDDWPHQD